MNNLIGFVIRKRKAVIVITLLITVFFSYFIKDLKINPDLTGYFPKSDPVVRLFNYLGQEYNGNHLAMIALESNEVFSVETIRQIQLLTAGFQAVDGVSYVTSLTNILDIKGSHDGLEIGKLIDPNDLPVNLSELKELKEYTLGKELYRGRLISEDGKATLIICRLQNEIDKVKVAGELKKVVKGIVPGEDVYYGGLPFLMLDINEIIINDLKFLIPLVVLVIMAALFFCFRSIRGVIIPVCAVAFSTIWTLGLMSILKIPLTIISNTIPVILFAVGNAYGIHVFSKFRETVVSDEEREVQSFQALREVGLPVLLAALTTIAGFLSFIFGSYLTMIREFGFFSGIGVFFALIISLTFIPAVLASLRVKGISAMKTGQISDSNRTSGMMKILGKWILKNERIIAIIGILVLCFGLSGIPKIQRRADILDYFKPESNIRRAEAMMGRKFGGSTILQILAQGDMQDPLVLKEIKKLENFLDSLPNLHNSQSIADLIIEINDVMGEGRIIPESRAKVSNLWFLLEGEETLDQLVDSAKTEAIIQATMANLDTGQARLIVEKVEDYLKNRTNPDLVTFSLTGQPVILTHLDDSILQSQIYSLIIALTLVFICLVWLLHSFRGGLIGITPIILTLIVIMGVMGFGKIPLDIATVLVAGIAIGSGIDYSIHFISRYRREFQEGNSIRETLRATLDTTGQAIIFNVITVTSGFLVLLPANLVPLQRFAVLVALTTVGAGLGAITVLPTFIQVVKVGLNGMPRLSTSKKKYTQKGGRKNA